MCDLIIREFDKEDLDSVLDIEEKCFPKEQRYSVEVFIEYHKRDPELFLVAELDGKIVGYVIGAQIEDWGHIVSLAVHPDYRRRGIGESLLKNIEERLIKRRVKLLLLEVAVSNKPAINLYLKHGYQPVRILKKYYEVEDALLMLKLVK